MEDNKKIVIDLTQCDPLEAYTFRNSDEETVPYTPDTDEESDEGSHTEMSSDEESDEGSKIEISSDTAERLDEDVSWIHIEDENEHPSIG